MPPSNVESQPLLGHTNGSSRPKTFFANVKDQLTPKKVVGVLLALLLVVGTGVSIARYARWREGLKDPAVKALYVLDRHPLVVSSL